MTIHNQLMFKLNSLLKVFSTLNTITGFPGYSASSLFLNHVNPVISRNPVQTFTASIMYINIRSTNSPPHRPHQGGGVLNKMLTDTTLTSADRRTQNKRSPSQSLQSNARRTCRVSPLQPLSRPPGCKATEHEVLSVER